MHNMGVYKITNTKTGQFYIGSSCHLRARRNGHKNELMRGDHSNPYLQNAWNKYGQSSFIFEVLETTNNRDELFEMEQKWLDKTKCYNRDIGYNIARYADTNFRRLSKETIKKIAELHKKGVHYKIIAKITNVSIATVHDIKNGHVYREINGLKKINYKPNTISAKDAKNIARVCKNARKRNIAIKNVAERLCRVYGVAISTIYDIASGRSWSHATGIQHKKTRKQLNENEVNSLWKELNSGVDEGAICKKYNMTKDYLNRIKAGEIWGSVTGVIYTRQMLNKDQVIDIFVRSHNGESTNKLAKEYNVTPTTIRRIKNRQTWKDITKHIQI